MTYPKVTMHRFVCSSCGVTCMSASLRSDELQAVHVCHEPSEDVLDLADEKVLTGDARREH